MKVIGISDLHGILPEIEEQADICVICGDISPLLLQTSAKKIQRWLGEEFIPWTEELNCEEVFMIGGNHDMIFQEHEEIVFKNTKITYLRDQLIKYKGYSIYGTPWCSKFGKWAFMLKPDQLREKYDLIPEKLDLLITHDVPYGCNDVILEDVHWKGQHLGNPELLLAIRTKKPKNLCCGHLHGSDHTPTKFYDTIVRQCSIVNEQYKLAYKPQIFEI